jgi:ribosomal protein S27AE
MAYDKERSKCPHCFYTNKISEWIVEEGAVVRCPKCGKETMDICYTIPIPLEGVTVTLEGREAAALALLCQRMSMETIGPFASDNAETHLMHETLETIRDQLFAVGFNPAGVPAHETNR